MSEHTQEPWGDDGRGHGVITDAHGRTVATANRPEDSRRIVACVNACAGIPTENLERNADMTRTLFDYAVRDVEQQRDKLLAAMKEICALGNGDAMIHAKNIANAIIAEVEAAK